MGVKCPKGCGEFESVGSHWVQVHDEPLPLSLRKTKTCQRCGDQFPCSPNRPQKQCSECYQKHGRLESSNAKISQAKSGNRATTDCARCGESFECPPSQQHKNRQCNSCWKEHGMMPESREAANSHLEPGNPSGSEHPKYTGNVRAGLSMREWYELRDEVFEVYGEDCSSCGESHERMAVHHVDGNETNNELSNLRPLCPSCHAKLHHAQGDLEVFPHD